MMTSSNLATAVRRAQAGDPHGIEALYAAYGDALWRYCYLRLNDREAARDCVQEVFVQVWKAIGSFEYRTEQAFVGWLYAIANNLLIDDARRRSRRPQTTTLEPWVIDPQETQHAGAICDRLTLREALAHLPAEQQNVVALRFFAGLSHAEIGAILQRSEGAVKALQHRALRRLQQTLAPEPALQPIRLAFAEA